MVHAGKWSLNHYPVWYSKDTVSCTEMQYEDTQGPPQCIEVNSDSVILSSYSLS